MAHGDHHGVVGIEVLGVELMVVGSDHRAAWVAVLLLHLVQFVLHHLLAKLGVVENLVEVVDGLHQLVEFIVQLLQAQARELAEAHIHDRLALQFVQFESLLQVALCVARSLAGTDNVYHLVDVVAGNDETLEDVGALLCLLQVELCAADGHVVTVLHKVLHAFLQTQETWTASHEGDAVHGEGTLEGSHLEELVEEYVGIGVALHVHHDAHTLSARLVVHVRHAVYLALLGEVGDGHHELLLVHAVGNLGHDDLVVALAALNLCRGAHHDASASCLVGVLHALDAINGGTRGEVGGGDVLHQSVGVDVGVVDIGTAAVDHLSEVVGGNIGSHTHGDTAAAVHQQVRDLGRHHRWLLEGVVEVVHHVDGLLVEVVHDVLSHLGEPALGVTHGGR